MTPLVDIRRRAWILVRVGEDAAASSNHVIARSWRVFAAHWSALVPVAAVNAAPACLGAYGWWQARLAELAAHGLTGAAITVLVIGWGTGRSVPWPRALPGMRRSPTTRHS